MELTTSKKILIGLAVALWIILFQYEKNKIIFGHRAPKPYYMNSLQTNVKIDSHEPAVKTFEKMKKILYFTKFFEATNFGFGFEQKPFEDFGCPVTNCYATNNRSLLGNNKQLLFCIEIFMLTHSLKYFC